MYKKVFLALTLLPFALHANSKPDFHRMQEIIKMKNLKTAQYLNQVLEGRLKPLLQPSLAKGYVETATYLDSKSIVEPKCGAGGLIPILISAIIPYYNDIDTTYSNIVDLKVVEKNPNSSTQFYIGFPPDTNIPISSVTLEKGEAFIWLKNTEPEPLIFWAMPQDSLKPSHPTVYTFNPSGTTPVKLKIYGPQKVNAYEEFSARYLVRVEDASGYPVPSYGDIIDTTRVRIDVIDDDSSAILYDFASGDSGYSIIAYLVSGQANIYLSNPQVEKINLVATSVFADLAGDTFEVDCRPPQEALNLVLWSPAGVYGTQNVDKVIMAIAIPCAEGEGEQDIDNSSSIVELAPTDIMGTASTQISPSGENTLIGGIASFILQDTEPDSGVIIEINTSGTPELYPAWWCGGEKLAYGFKKPGNAIQIYPSGPASVLTGDTAGIFAYAVDGNNSLDTTYTGWIEAYAEDDNWSSQLLDATGMQTNLFYINNGIAEVYVTNTENEMVDIRFEDAEGDGPFSYLGTAKSNEARLIISFEEPGSIATHWIVEFPKSANIFFPIGEPITATLKAVDDLGFVDTSFYNDGNLAITGYTMFNDFIPLNKGIGTFTFRNDSIEEVVMTISGSFPSWEDTIYFAPRNSALWLFPQGKDEVLVNDSLKCILYAMTPQFNIDYNWNGVAKLEFQDPGSSSISWLGNPDSIPITNGYGTITMLNSEIESVLVDIKLVSGTSPLVPQDAPHILRFQAKLKAQLPDYGSVGGPTDIIYFKTVDALGNTLPHTTWIYPWCVDEDFDYSVTWNPKDSLQIVNGTGILEIENTEPETVWINICTWTDKLIQEVPEPFATLVFKPLSDTIPPTSCIASSPTTSAKLNFPVSWTLGQDIGSGLSGLYKIMAKNASKGIWEVWIDSTNATSANYKGVQAQKYYFEAGAYDNAGNLELFYGTPECSTYIDTLLSDTAAPSPPEGLTAIGGDRAAFLYWNPNPEPDIMGYNVYRQELATWERINPYLVKGRWYRDKDLENDSTFWYRVTAVDSSNNESKHSTMVYAPTSNLPPGPVRGFTGMPVEGSRVKLSWITSPSYDVLKYTIYWNAGSGEIDYSTPLVFLYHPDTTWTSDPLPLGQRYKFGIRASDDVQEEENENLIVSVLTEDYPQGVMKSRILTPFAGKHIWGKRITVAGKIIYGSIPGIKCVNFQYKLAGAAEWENIPPAVPQFTNPDSLFPYFIFWDVTSLSPGIYNLCSVAMDTGGKLDENPSWITIAIIEDFPDEEEGADSAKISEHWKKEKIYHNSNNYVYCGTGDENSINITMIPAYALYNDTRLVYYIRTPENYVTDPYKSANQVREVWFENGQQILLDQKLLRLTIPYLDEDQDGFIDNTDSLKETELWMGYYNEISAGWDSISISVPDALNNTFTGWWNTTGLFALLGPKKTGIEETSDRLQVAGCRLKVYPNPFTAGVRVQWSGISENQKISLRIYDLSGRLVKTLMSGQGTRPTQGAVEWDAKDNRGKRVANGVYFIRLSAGEIKKTTKLIIVR